MLPCYFHSSDSLEPRQGVWAPKDMLGTKMAVEEAWMSPEQKQHGLWKGLEIVVSVDLCAILKSHLAKHLWVHRACVRVENPCPYRLSPISYLPVLKRVLDQKSLTDV